MCMNMYRQFLSLVVLNVLFFATAFAQNLVPNPSFEIKTDCPGYLHEIWKAVPWNTPTQGTPDYFHECSYDMFLDVPSNQFGNQWARTGEAYAGFYVFYNSTFAPPPIPTYREYIQAPLTQPLIPGKKYKVEFYVSLCDYSKYGTDGVAALFSTNPISRNDDSVIVNYNPQVKQPDGITITNKTSWTLISGCFEADSAYNYITIGCFKNGDDIQFTPTPSLYMEHYAYYFIDDISVEELAAPELEDSVAVCFENVLTLDAKDSANFYLWSTGDTTQTIDVTTPGMYYVTRGFEGCVVDDSIKAIFSDGIPFELGNDTLAAFCENGPLTIGIENISNAQFIWSNGSTTSQTQVHQPGSYTLMITDVYGCTTSDNIKVSDLCPHYLYMPNVFSPNRDNINDEFKCACEGLTYYNLNIYNRWGEKVFSTNDYTKGWNGKYCDVGVYTYTASYDTGSGALQHLNGTVLLMR